VGPGDRELHALVGADWLAEDHALPGIGDRLVGEPAAVPDGLRGDQDALGVHAGQDVREALAFLAHQAVSRDRRVVEEERVGRVVHHHAQWSDLEALEAADVDQEHAEAVGAPLHLIGRRGAGQQQHEIGLQRARDEHLAAVDDVTVTPPRGRGLQLGGIGARVGLGDAEGLQPQLAGGDLGQVGPLLRLAAVPQHGAHDVHLGVTGGGAAAAGVDGFQDEPGLAHAQAGPAVLGRNETGQVTGLGQLVDELLGILPPAVEIAPVLARIAFADLGHAVAESALLVGEAQGDGCHVAPRRQCPLNCGRRFSLKARTPSSRSSVTTVALYASMARIIAVSRSVSLP
jgi:hypothetical protein